MWEEVENQRQAFVVVATIAGILFIVITPLAWTIRRVLRPVDRAARERNLPFRFSLGDFLCLFWIVQLPLTFVFRFGGARDSDRPGDDEVEQFYWILTAAVWVVAPLAWFTVARALSKAGVAAVLHRMIFLGLVLPIVYYGLFPFIGISLAGMVGILNEGLVMLRGWKSLTAVWFFLLIGLVVSGFYSPWMVQHAGTIDNDEEDVDDSVELGSMETG